MNEEQRKNENLTILNRKPEWYLDGTEGLVVETVTIHTLSKPERRQREREIAKAWKRKHRKKYTRKVGTVHPKRKAATKRRRLKKNWATNPFGCIIHGYGAYSMDREKWDRYIQPLWERYDPAELQVKKYKRDILGEYVGTRKNPYTIYTMDVLHKTEGLLYCGVDQQIHDMSSI